MLAIANSVVKLNQIMISNALEEKSPYAKPMKDFHGEQLLLPHKEQYFPSVEALQWHYKNIFQR